MDCAVCHNPMITLELDKVETDYCLSCRGIWLDSGELEQLLGDSSRAQDLLHSFKIAASSREKVRRCPICGKKMEKVFVGPESQQVLIDRCKKAHGLWFDRGELEAVLHLGRFDSEGKVPKLLGKIFKSPETKEDVVPS